MYGSGGPCDPKMTHVPYSMPQLRSQNSSADPFNKQTHCHIHIHAPPETATGKSREEARTAFRARDGGGSEGDGGGGVQGGGGSEGGGSERGRTGGGDEGGAEQAVAEKRRSGRVVEARAAGGWMRVVARVVEVKTS